MKQFTKEQYTNTDLHTEELHNHVRHLTKEILIDIKEGKLKHDQSLYHAPCGTEHCIAGWLEIKILEELKITWYYKNCDDGDYQLEDLSPIIGEYITNKYEAPYNFEILNNGIWNFAEDLLNLQVETLGRGSGKNLFNGWLNINSIIRNWNLIVEMNSWNSNLKV